MIDRIADLQSRVQRSRAALEALTLRATEVRHRLEVASGSAPTPPTTELAASLERLAQVPTPSPSDEVTQVDGEFISDAWEIALINEEGK